jgi:putative transposase
MHGDTQYVFQGCPFGLKPISSKFQRVMAKLLQDLPFATAFVDDIVIFSKTLHDHISHVKVVIERLTAVNLVLNPDKCHFAHESVTLLGFCISAAGVALDSKKVTNVQDWPQPRTGKDIQRFLGLVNFFRLHIPNMSQLAHALNPLREAASLKKLWTPACQASFDSLKYALRHAPILSFPALDHPFYVATDASNLGIGAVLYQIIDKKTKYIGFHARSLSRSERNYSTTKRELLGIIFALKKFHKYLWGNRFILFTDHRALTYLHTQPDINPMMSNWLDTLLDYNFEVCHLPGNTNVLPDALSRLFDPRPSLAGGEGTEEAAHMRSLKRKRKCEADFENDDLHEMQVQVEDELFEPLDRDVKVILNSFHRSMHVRDLESEETHTPKEQERREILARQHSLGHFGADAIVRAVHELGMHWPKLKENAVELVKQCQQCMQYNITRKGYHPLKSITSNGPGEHWAIDLAGPFPTSHRGNHYLFVMVDIFSKYVILEAIPDKTSVTIARVLVNTFCKFGFPKVLQSDNGTEFINELVQLVCRESRIDHRLVTPYHPRANGAAERMVQTTTLVLKKELNSQLKDWDEYVPMVAYATNAKIAPLHNSAPFSLMFFRRLNGFIDYRSDDPQIERHVPSIQERDNVEELIDNVEHVIIPAITKRIETVRDASKNSFNKKNKIIEFGIGSLVAIAKPTMTRKLEPKYEGPFQVVEKNQGGAYKLKDIRLDELLPGTYAPHSLKSVSEDPTIQSEPSYEIDCIVDHGYDDDDKLLYKVKWKNYPGEDSWVSIEDFDSGTTSIHDYWQAKTNKRVRKGRQ